MSYNFSDLQDFKWHSELKYKIYKVDINNRNKAIISEHYFSVLEKSMFIERQQYDYTKYVDYEKLSKMKQPKYYYLLDRDSKLEIIDNFHNDDTNKIDDRIKIKSVHDINLLLSDSVTSAVEQLKKAYDNHMNVLPFAANVYLFTEQ